MLPHLPGGLSLGLKVYPPPGQGCGLVWDGGNAGGFVVQPFQRGFVDLCFTLMLTQIEQKRKKKEKPEFPGQTGKGWRWKCPNEDSLATCSTQCRAGLAGDGQQHPSLGTGTCAWGAWVSNGNKNMRFRVFGF